MALKPVGGSSQTTAPTAPEAERFTPEYFAGLGRSAAQGITFGTADELEAFIRSAIGETTYKQERDKIRAELEKFRSDFPVEAYGTEIAASIPTAGGLAKSLAGLGVRGAVKQAGIGGALYGAGAAEEMEDVPLSATLGAGIGMGAQKIAPTISREAQALIKKGIPVTPGQLFGGGAKRAEEMLTSVPIMGQGIIRAQQRAMRAFPASMYNDALKPIGVKIPTDLPPRAAYNKAKAEFNKRYTKVLEGVEINVTDDLVNDIARVADDVRATLPAQQAKTFDDAIQSQIFNRAVGDKLTGKAIQDIQKNFGREAYKYGTAPGASGYDRALAEAFDAVDEKMMDVLAKYAPQKATELKQINKAYSNFKPLERAAAGAEESAFTPAQALRAARAEARRQQGARAAGEARMQRQAELAKRVIGTEVPDSATPARAMTAAAYGALAGLPVGMSAEGALAALGAGLFGRGMYTPLGQAALRRGIPAAGIALRAPATAGLLAQEAGPRLPRVDITESLPFQRRMGQ